MIQAPQVTYELDPETWGKTFDIAKIPENTPPQLNNYILLMIVRYELKEYVNKELWEEFKEGFEGWTETHFSQASREATKDMCKYLMAHGVWARQRGNISYAKTLSNLLEEDEPHQWTDDDIAHNNGQGLIPEPVRIQRNQFQTNPEIRNKIQTPVRLTTEVELQPQSMSQTESEHRQQSRVRLRTQEPTIESELYNATPTQNNYIRTNQEYNDNQRFRDQTYPRFTPIPHPSLQEYQNNQATDHNYLYERDNRQPSQNRRQETTEPFVRLQTTSDPSEAAISRARSDLIKIYTNNDKQKYGAEPYDIFSLKLQTFCGNCDLVRFPKDNFHEVFQIMLKGNVLLFFEQMIQGRKYSFRTMERIIRGHFETDEVRQKYMNEWQTTTLTSIIRTNRGKTIMECLELLFIHLRLVQQGLSPEYHTENALRDRIINACVGVPECKPALFRTASTLEGVCSDLRSTVGTEIRSREAAAYLQDQEQTEAYEYDQYWVDRTYEGQVKRFPSRTNQNPRWQQGNSNTPARQYQRLGNTLTRQYQGNGKQPVNPNYDRTNKKCYVCQKQGCWSTKHTEAERKASYKKIGQFITEFGFDEDQLEAFLASTENSSKDSYEAIQEPKEEHQDERQEGEIFLSEYGEINGFQMVSELNDQTIRHAILQTNASIEPYDVFTINGRYSSETFQGIMPDSGAAGISTAGEPQIQALQKQLPQLKIDRTTAGDNTIRFGKGTTMSKGTITIDTPLGEITFHVVPTDTPFLLCIQDMDKLSVRLDNLNNTLVQGEKIIPIVRKWGHPWMLLGNKEQTLSYSHLTETELRQLHRRFGHPSSKRLIQILHRAGYEENARTIEEIEKVCQQCQLNEKAPGRFKFKITDDYEFNYEIIADVFYLDGKPILHVVDEATAFTAARFLKDELAKTLWNTLRNCWIDVYIGPPDRIVHDAGKNFSSEEFRANARTIGSETKPVPVEAHQSVGKVERYHAILRRIYNIFQDELREQQLDRHTILQMAVKAVNDTAGPNGLVPTLLVFGAYPRLNVDDTPSQAMIQRAKTMYEAMKEVRRLKAKRQIADALATRNGPNTGNTEQLPLLSDVRVWREKEGWTGPFKLISITGKECRIEMPYGQANFRISSVKPFYQDKIEERKVIEVRTTPELAKGPQEHSTRPVVLLPRKSIRQLQSQTEAFLSKKEENDRDLSRTMREKGIITAPGLPFEESQQIEIDGLIAGGVFEFVQFNPNIHKGRIFNSRLVNEVKGQTTTPYEKSRLVIQAYNDQGKEEILTQSPTIQRVSQRLIIALAPSLFHQGIKLFSRDITQAYVQSTTKLNRTILAKIPKELRNSFPEGTIMLVRKPLYGIPEAGTHWWATYNEHHKEKLGMEHSSYDPCLLISTDRTAFGLVGMQTDDTLILGSTKFKDQENRELKKAKFLAKPVDDLSDEEPLVFNGCILKSQNESILLVQKGQGTKIQQIQLDSKDRTANYREQRARGAYIATICQPEAMFDLSVAAQHQEPSDEEVKALNKRLEWQIQNVERGIRYINLDLNRTKLFVFVDGSFANNKDLSSQIGYVIILANEEASDEENSFLLRGNLVHWSSTKSKRVTRSVLASEIYGMVSGVDMSIVIKTTLDKITEQLNLPQVQIIVCTDSYSLYECLVKLGTTKEKRLMIDIMALRQSYERRELTEVRWINGQDNLADAMTKANPNQMLTKFLDINESIVRLEGWVKREEK